MFISFFKLLRPTSSLLQCPPKFLSHLPWIYSVAQPAMSSWAGNHQPTMDPEFILLRLHWQMNSLQDLVLKIVLDTLLNELKSKLDDLSSGRSRSQPQCTPWQHWKSEACTIIGTSRQGQKSTRMFRCFDDNCHWRDKCVTLNAYINHLKGNHMI